MKEKKMIRLYAACMIALGIFVLLSCSSPTSGDKIGGYAKYSSSITGTTMEFKEDGSCIITYSDGRETKCRYKGDATVDGTIFIDFTSMGSYESVEIKGGSFTYMVGKYTKTSGNSSDKGENSSNNSSGKDENGSSNSYDDKNSSNSKTISAEYSRNYNLYYEPETSYGSIRVTETFYFYNDNSFELKAETGSTETMIDRGIYTGNVNGNSSVVIIGQDNNRITVSIVDDKFVYSEEVYAKKSKNFFF